MAQYSLTNADIIKGGHLMVFVYNSTNSTYEPLAFATSHSLQKTLNTSEVSTKDHGDFAAVLPQNITWQITTDNLYSVQGYTTLNTIFNTMKTVKVRFGESTYDNTQVQQSIVWDGTGTKSDDWAPMTGGYVEEGEAYITSLQVTAGAGDNATYQATFTGSGSLETVTIS